MDVEGIEGRKNEEENARGRKENEASLLHICMWTTSLMRVFPCSRGTNNMADGQRLLPLAYTPLVVLGRLLPLAYPAWGSGKTPGMLWEETAMAPLVVFNFHSPPRAFVRFCIAPRHVAFPNSLLHSQSVRLLVFYRPVSFSRSPLPRLFSPSTPANSGCLPRRHLLVQGRLCLLRRYIGAV